MTNKLLFRISISETLIDELENFDAYKADCITYYTERVFEEFSDEELSNMNIDDFRREVYNRINNSSSFQ